MHFAVVQLAAIGVTVEYLDADMMKGMSHERQKKSTQNTQVTPARKTWGAAGVDHVPADCAACWAQQRSPKSVLFAVQSFVAFHTAV